MESEGNGGTQIMKGGPGRPGELFMDLPGSYSHEYFPRVSNDGRWLVWGAAAKGHEHDRADYEIFVWQIGRPTSEAVRLTHHPETISGRTSTCPARRPGPGGRGPGPARPQRAVEG